MDRDEVGRLLGQADTQLRRARMSYDAATRYPGAELAQQNVAELRTGLAELQQVVARLILAARDPREADERRALRCDRCGAPTSEYGDCLGGNHITTPLLR